MNIESKLCFAACFSFVVRIFEKNLKSY